MLANLLRWLRGDRARLVAWAAALADGDRTFGGWAG